MTVPVTIRPSSQHFGPSAPTTSPGFAYSPQKRPAVRSHYRPYSTLYVKEEESPTRIVSHRSSVLLKSRRHSTIHRSVSLGDAMGLGKRKAVEKESKEKAQAPQIRKLSDIRAPTPETETNPTTKAAMSRPSTSHGGLTMVDRSHINGKASALHRVKAQRSIGSLFTAAAAADVSPNAATLEQPLRSRQHAFTTPTNTFRPRKMDVVSSKRPRTASNPRPRRPSSKDNDDGPSMKKAGPLDSDVWLTRSRTRVHPYSEVPYMQSYDIPSFDNDRFTELLLERMNPGSPSFHDYGRKYPLTVLDLGCGQGDWCIYAASIWKHSRIFGFDLMEVTLPAFQATDNLKFVQGNFLNALPFPDKTFDFVRMANLSLCIPYDKWLPLLNEVRRVMTNNGRLEVIDDQMMFPYGEEPHSKEMPIPDVEEEQTPTEKVVVPEGHRYPQQSSFFNFNSDSESETTGADEEDSYEMETSTSTSSTLVSERDSGYFDKVPSSKRSSAQSNASTSVESERRYSSDVAQPLSITLAANVQVLPTQPTISPSPTVTQATFHTLDPDASTVSQALTITDRSRHKKSDSTSSTRSNSEVIASWKTKKLGCIELETIFEHILVERYGIHPRPSEFLGDILDRTFGSKNAGKVKSFHIKLAPFDSPIGPGGAFAVQKAVDSAVAKAEKAKKKSKRDKWDGKKEKRRDPKKLEKTDSPRGSLEQAPPPMVHPGMLTVKAASRLGLPAYPSAPTRRHTESPTGSEPQPNTTEKRLSANLPSSGSSMPIVTAKAANRLGIPVLPPPVPPKSEAIVKSYVIGSKRNSDPRPFDTTVRLVPRQNVSASSLTTDDSSGTFTITPTNSFRGGDQVERTASGSSTTSTSSDGSEISLAEALRGDLTAKKTFTLAEALKEDLTSTTKKTLTLAEALLVEPPPPPPPAPKSIARHGKATSSSSSSSNSSEDSTISLGEALRGDFTPPQLSAKAAGRLGVKYSILAAASATHSRGAGVMVPVQSPGILVWPSTYIPIPPAELEMHSCKWIQTLLTCRHALREYITGPFEGTKLVDDEEFDEAIWDYECFRRSRFHWPNDNPELFADDGVPEPPSPTSAPNPSREQTQLALQAEQDREAARLNTVFSNGSNTDTFNGQYRRDALTHVRTIRVFHAVKNVEDKSFVQALFSGR